MHYGKINKYDIANGPGVRVSLFVSGCRNNCPGCFNKESQDFNYGELFIFNTFQELMDSLKPDHIEGLTILGGDPFEPENIVELTDICKSVKQYYPTKTIWIYTGYLWDDFKDHEIMNYIDVLVDGPFIEDLKDLRLRFRGSSNQRIIDISKSKKHNCALRWEEG